VSKVKPRLVVVTVAPAAKTPTRIVCSSAAAAAKVVVALPAGQRQDDGLVRPGW
jgi:hypothetical protein